MKKGDGFIYGKGAFVSVHPGESFNNTGLV
jgi:hypothetical protein